MKSRPQGRKLRWQLGSKTFHYFRRNLHSASSLYITVYTNPRLGESPGISTHNLVVTGGQTVTTAPCTSLLCSTCPCAKNRRIIDAPRCEMQEVRRELNPSGPKWQPWETLRQAGWTINTDLWLFCTEGWIGQVNLRTPGAMHNPYTTRGGNNQHLSITLRLSRTAVRLKNKLWMKNGVLGKIDMTSWRENGDH